MKVAEMIQELQKVNPEAELVLAKAVEGGTIDYTPEGIAWEWSPFTVRMMVVDPYRAAEVPKK